ncbi:hypothetical protein E0L16_11970 [Enterobacter quasihormaechei]|uniref:Uncharacterized protein n=1 Tax=Enterobacter quasihormaechei TaxID=2529382 RepID=A0AAE8UBK3_9ENTR|nr:hypothetical protein [Enterobacter quasihormaechei]TCB87087.1 hypothetical protein E0L16_11970 [Enterobacter quasihormaechei]
MPDDSIIVIDIAGDIVKIRVLGRNLISKMQAIGFLLKDELMVLPVVDDQDKQRVITQLVNEGALFLFGYGWYPSEVMEYYKEQNINFGKYKIIYWSDKDTYHIEER